MDAVAAREVLADQLERFLQYAVCRPGDHRAAKLAEGWVFGACRAAVALGLMSEPEADLWDRRAEMAAERALRSPSAGAR